MGRQATSSVQPGGEDLSRQARESRLNCSETDSDDRDGEMSYWTGRLHKTLVIGAGQ